MIKWTHNWNFIAHLYFKFSIKKFKFDLKLNFTCDTSNNNNILAANNYLTKNNAICFELISNRNFSWLLHYESSSQVEIDVPENLSEMIQQYICNLNDYFYTSFYTISHFYYIWRSEHSTLQKISLQIEIIYQAFHLFLSWLALVIIKLCVSICFFNLKIIDLLFF